jgi:methyl-accepting chemotaxis protein WspA
MRVADLSFKQRILLLALLFLLGYGALVALAAATLDRVMINGSLYQRVRSDQALHDDTHPPRLSPRALVLSAHQLVSADASGRVGVLEDLTDERKTLLEGYADWRKRLQVAGPEYAEVKDKLRDGGQIDILVNRIVEKVDDLRAEVEKSGGVAEVERASHAAQLAERLQSIDADSSICRQELEKVTNEAQRLLEQSEKEASDAVASGRRTALLVTIAFLALMGVAAWWLLGSILRSVATINERMREMAQADADLSTRLGIQGKDEVGQLAHWIDAFVEKIAQLVRAVKKSTIQLRSTATEMAATSHEQQATVSSFGATSAQIAAAVKEISATGGELSQTMTEVGHVARDSAAIATEGRSSLGEMQTSMGHLASSSGSISNKLAAINEKAREITGVVTTITKVADQTNLLSVNAAIEAEKAGEYGRGFLVVAREIRRLADQTASATLDIEQTVQQMQGAVSAGVMEMDKFAAQVRKSVDEVDAISAKLGQIIERVELLTSRFDSVTEGMTSQAVGVRQINEAMGSLAENVRVTSQSLSEFTSAAEEMKQSVEGLKGELAQFRLED